MWIYFGLLAALFLSFNALARKRSVTGNAVFPVLLVSNATSLLLLLPAFIGSIFYAEQMKNIGFYMPSISLEDHFLIGIKSVLMTCSWILNFYALKHLPITIVTPIRGAGPFFTFIGAVIIYHESPELLQWIGFFLIIISMIFYSRIGKKEGIVFKNNKWILAIVGATFFGSVSGLYDKFLFQYKDYEVLTVQWWFFFYVTFFMLLLVLFVYKPNKDKMGKFKLHWTILASGVLIFLADYFYFKGLQDPEALIMIMSAVKRSQILFTVLIGGLIFKEQNRRMKLIPLLGILIGVFCILYSS
ncbi:drug/metabolite transporter (DMT)-like permease [Wenyingzhuangia heitensis]|uniref:Drug/metabolite transporter (DMT)-like permease n=1 Tax=Wenyingzhuangia heitensis TaxID=1487859 RepID=A0ABX0UAU6_9FLAO|nr:DMT family transporter [Wenyingzhuangia heitensis]NIJ45848.1 drug/metabolite transporter (DMT)-like permease [Wenyingzhuangia heitensis]